MGELDWQKIAPHAYQCVQAFGNLVCRARVHQIENGKWMHNVILRDMSQPIEAGTGHTDGRAVAFFLSEQKPSFEQAKAAAEGQWTKIVQRHIPRSSPVFQQTGLSREG